MITIVDSPLWGPRALALLRIVAGLLFVAHGVVKLFGFPEGLSLGRSRYSACSG